MAFAMPVIDPETNSLPYLVRIHLTSYWDEIAAQELGLNPSYINPFGIQKAAEAYELVNKINTLAYKREYDWRQSLRERRRVPIGLKVASDMTNPSYPFEVAYMVIGHEVYFTGLGKWGRATIRFAEQFVKVICEDMNVSPSSFTFFDIGMIVDGTHSSYQLNELIPKPSRNSFVVHAWRPIATSPKNKYTTKPANLFDFPPEVLEVFYDFLFFQGERAEHSTF